MSIEKLYFVYIMAKGRNSTFYTGFSTDLPARAENHKEGTVNGFTKKHGVNMLVYYETYTDCDAALHREKQLKKWHRTWKMRLIEELNPGWEDLHDSIPQ